MSIKEYSEMSNKFFINYVKTKTEERGTQVYVGISNHQELGEEDGKIPASKTAISIRDKSRVHDERLVNVVSKLLTEVFSCKKADTEKAIQYVEECREQLENYNMWK